MELAEANNELSLQILTCKKELSQAHALAAERGKALAEVRARAADRYPSVIIMHVKRHNS